MKIKFLNILSVMLLGVLVIFSSCEEKDDYDYNSIVPIVHSITGPNNVSAHGLPQYPFQYYAPHRGGSTFQWTIGGNGGTFVVDPVYPSIINVVFNQSDDDTQATITVVETTMGGIASQPFTRTISLLGFCPYDMNNFAGDWHSSHGAADDPVVATVEPGINVLRIKGLAGFVNFSWGENWTLGDGSCVAEFSCGYNIEIKPQWIGNSDYPDVYGIIGSGTYDPATDAITLSYEVFWGWTGSTGQSALGTINAVLTRGSKEITQKEGLPIAKKQ